MGTKEDFRNFLVGKGMTYTKYTTLSIEAKAGLYKEYQAKGRKKAKPPQDDQTATDQVATVAA